MILGVDHVALSCSDLNAAGTLLAAHGFEPKLTKTGLANAPEKRPFVTDWSPEHDIAVYGAGRGIAIELTRHARPLQVGAPGYRVLFDGPLGDADSGASPTAGNETWRAAFDVLVGAETRAAHWSDLHVDVWQTDRKATEGIAVRALVCPTHDLQASRVFWTTGLGFKERTTSATTSELAIQSPIPSWCLSVILVESKFAGPKSMMDDAGFPVLAVLTNRIEADLDRLRAAGGREASGIFDLTPGDRAMRIAIVRGPSNELIELIEVQRARPLAEKSHADTTNR